MKIKTIATCVLLLAALDAQGYQQDYCWKDRGAYIELNAGIPFVALGFVGVPFDSIAGSLNVGYQFNRYFAIEVGENGFVGDHRLFLATDIAAKGIIPITPRWNLFGKLGGAYAYMKLIDEDKDVRANAVAAFVGVGTAYKLTSQVDLNLQASAETVGIATVGQVTMGVTYHFHGVTS